MSQPKKETRAPREFWIDDILNVDRPYMRASYIYEQDAEKCIGETIHVIEYSAFESLSQKYKELESKCRVYEKVNYKLESFHQNKAWDQELKYNILKSNFDKLMKIADGFSDINTFENIEPRKKFDAFKKEVSGE